MPRVLSDGLTSGQFGLGVGNPYNPDCDIHMFVRDGFSSLRIEGTFFARHRDLFPTRNKPDQRKLALMDSPVYPNGIDGLGALSNMTHISLAQAAGKLSREIEHIEKIADRCVDVLDQLGMMDVFSLYRDTRDISFELIHYNDGERVSALDHFEPTHTDQEVRAVVLSISLGDDSDPWVIGRDKQSLEVVLQKSKDLIVMDTDVDYLRQPPIHSPIVEGHDRDSLVIILRNDALNVAFRALPKLALNNNWRANNVEPIPANSLGIMSEISTQLERIRTR